MEKIKNFVMENKENKLQFTILICAGLAGFNCLTRPDYNFIVYLYIYYVWNYMNEIKEEQAVEKIHCIYFLCFSFIVDIVWTIFWSGKWSHVKDIEKTAHIIVVVLSWILIVFKAFMVFALSLIEWNSVKSSLPSKLLEKLNIKYEEQKDEII